MTFSQGQPIRPQQCYTRQEPDGTIVTTTVQTKYEGTRPHGGGTNYMEESVTELGCGPGTLNKRYCLEPIGILRIVEIIICLIIISLLTSVFGPGPFKGILFAQTLIMIFDGVALCFTFIFLLVYFLNIHRTHLDFWPWSKSDFYFSVVASLVFLVASFIEAYYSTGAWSNNCNDIGGDGVIHNGCRLIVEWAFAAFFCFVLCLLYALSAFLAHQDEREKRRNHLRRSEERRVGKECRN